MNPSGSAPGSHYLFCLLPFSHPIKGVKATCSHFKDIYGKRLTLYLLVFCFASYHFHTLLRGLKLLVHILRIFMERD